MVWKAALALTCFAVTACDDIPRARTESEIREISADEAIVQTAILRSEIAQLRGEIERLRGDLEVTDRYVGAVSRHLDATSERISANAKVQNANTLRDATRRGDCGTETVYPERIPGQVTPVMTVRNIPCTEENYWRAKK